MSEKLRSQKVGIAYEVEKKMEDVSRLPLRVRIPAAYSHLLLVLFEPHREKSGFLHMRKQRRR